MALRRAGHRGAAGCTDFVRLELVSCELVLFRGRMCQLFRAVQRLRLGSAVRTLRAIRRWESGRVCGFF